MRVRNSIIVAALAVAIGSAVPARAESVVRYGISMADIPLTTGQPDRGAGAYQFTAYTIYDPLVAWEMDVSDRPGKLVPGLATEWKVDDKDKTKWRFTLRQGVKFHDGSDFNADAVIWNLDKVLNDKAPQFDKRQSAQVKRASQPCPTSTMRRMIVSRWVFVIRSVERIELPSTKAPIICVRRASDRRFMVIVLTTY
jgi:peptide/nickel transport system substrate-binding protein